MSYERHDPQLEQIDATLLGILQHAGKIDDFLDRVFGFLYRRTDFYVLTNPGERFGFPPGIAEKIVATAYNKYEVIASKKQAAKLAEINRQLKTQQDAASKLTELGLAEKPQSVPAVQPAASSSNRSNEDKPKPKVETPAAVETVSKPAAEVASTEAASTVEKASSKRKGPEPGKTEVNDVYNGADCGSYFWCQTIREADVRVRVPPTCRSASAIKVELKRKYISVQLTENGETRTLASGTLTHEINTDESMWTLVPGEHVHFHLDKYPERWWDGVFEDQEKINLDKIEAVRPMDDLDEGAKMCVAGLMEDDRRKKLGLPTREEEKMYEMMRKGWDAPGSPYAGTPHPNDALYGRGPMPPPPRTPWSDDEDD